MKLHHVILISSLAAGACTDEQEPTIGRPLPVTPASVSAASVKNVRTLAEQLWRAENWLGETKGIGGLGAVFGSSEEAPIDDGTGSQGDARQRLILPDEQADFDEVMDNVTAFLNERVLVASQIESKTDTAVTYRLAPATFCDPEWEQFEDCKEVLAAIDVRVRATSLAEGDVDLTLLLGADQKRAAEFALHADLLSAQVELGEAADLLNRISVAFSEGEAVPVLTRASGTAGVSMRRLTAEDLELQAFVTAPIALTLTDGSASQTLDVEKGRASLGLNVAGDRAVVDVELGKIAVRGDKSLVVPSEESGGEACLATPDGGFECTPVEPEPAPEVTGTFTLTAGPIAAWAELTDDARHIDLKGLVAGPLALALDDTKVIEFTVGDLRPLDMLLEVTESPVPTPAPADPPVDPIDGMEPDAAQTIDATFSHGFAVTLFAKLAGQPDTFLLPNTSWTEDEELGAHADGEKPAFHISEAGMVVSGATLTLTSKMRPTVVVAAGQCVSAPTDAPLVEGDEPTSDDEHPWDLRVGDQCPAE